MSNQKIKIEICPQSLTSALIAQEGGADRIELCAALEVGGLTPSLASILKARQMLHIEICILIRPRAGDFCYSDLEFTTIKEDIIFCRDNGIDGVVVGILKPDGTLNMEQMKELVEIARPMDIICHRAFDQTPDPFATMEQLIELGFDRVLTSGQGVNALSGSKILRGLIEQADGRIEIMPGVGINPDNLGELIEKTGATSYHTSAQILVKSKMIPNENIPQFSAKAGRANDYFESSLDMVKELVAIAKSRS